MEQEENIENKQAHSSNTKRIAKNTLMLYFRQILIMLVSLYTVRVVLNTLGATDYGIYNVVAGVVTMFSFLSGAMATASQRYFSFDLGKKNYENLKTTFSVTFEIYLLLAFVVILFAETLGLWFVNNKLVIPADRLFAANCIYQSSIVSFLFTLITTPYMASIIAHENMNVYAYFSIIETFLRLGIVFLLKLVLMDKLVLYGVLLCCVTLINTSLYRFYCHKNYEECKVKFVWNKALFKELVSYSGWNMFGASIGVVKNQIMNIVLNLFFGPIVNAARGISAQVNSAVVSFGQNFSTAMRPQVIKSYAAGKIDDCMNLVYRGCKFTFFLMYIFILPLSLEMDFVLQIWLKNPPENAALFTKLALIDALIDCISYQIMTLAQATGKIKLYQSVVGGILLLNLPISYIFLKNGFPAYIVFVISICITLLAAIVRLFIIKRLTNFSISRFLLKAVLPCLLVSLLSAVVPYFVNISIKNIVVDFFVTVLVSVFMTILCILFIGLTKQERSNLKMQIKNKLGRKHEN